MTAMSLSLVTALSSSLTTALRVPVTTAWGQFVRAKVQITTSLAVLVFAATATAEPTPYRAIYRADYKGIPVSAKGIRELRREENGTYTLSSTARSFFGTVSESSIFTLQEDLMVPIQYTYRRTGLGKKRDATLKFDWDSMKVVNDVQSKPWEMQIPTGTMDKLLYQMKMRQELAFAHNQNLPWPDLAYQVADNGKLKQYHFEVVGEEETDTPVGAIKTIKVTRVKHNKKCFWGVGVGVLSRQC